MTKKVGFQPTRSKLRFFREITLWLVFSISKVNSNLNFTVSTELQSTNRLIAEAFIVIVFLSKSLTFFSYNTS